jgi:hypothetical protein
MCQCKFLILKRRPKAVRIKILYSIHIAYFFRSNSFLSQTSNKYYKPLELWIPVSCIQGREFDNLINTRRLKLKWDLVIEASIWDKVLRDNIYKLISERKRCEYIRRTPNDEME